MRRREGDRQRPCCFFFQNTIDMSSNRMTGWLVVFSNYEYSLGIGLVDLKTSIRVKGSPSLLIPVTRRQQTILWFIPPSLPSAPHHHSPDSA